MATFKIPNQGQVRQLNLNDTAGELWSSFNIDLRTNPGKIKLARPFKQVASDSDIGGDDVEAFAILLDKAYAYTTDGLFRAAPPFTSWSAAPDWSTAGNNGDMVVFDSQLVISGATEIDAYDGTNDTTGWWTARGNPSLTSGKPHIMEVIRIGTETLAVTDGNKVHAYTGGIGSGAILSSTVEFEETLTATCIKAAIRDVFIGTYTTEADQAYVVEWDGASTNYIQEYPVGAKAVLAMEMIDNAPLIVTERGEIKLFNNAGFSTVAQFPFASKPVFANGVETTLIQSNNLNRPIHPKGIKRAGNTVYIYANWLDASGNLLDEQTPCGLWALDLTTYSLSHLGSPNNESIFDTSSPMMVINERSGRIFLGGRRNNAGNDRGIWLEDLDDDSQNYGYFVTPEIESGSVQDVFNQITAKTLLGLDDEVIIKFRTSRDTRLPIIITDAAWTGVNENTFTSTDSNMATIKERYDAGHREEIEVLFGQSAGRLAHITSVTENTGTYTIVIDELIGVDGETSTIRFDNWQKIPNSMTASDGELKRLGAGAVGTWSQFKVAKKGKAGRPETRQLLIDSNTKES